MDTSKNPNTKAPQQDYESSSCDSTTSSSSNSQDDHLCPSETTECSNPGWRPLRSPGTWDPARPRNMSMEYITPDELNMPEILLPDSVVNFNDENGNSRKLSRAACTSPRGRNYPQYRAQLPESIKDAEYSPKTLPQNFGNHRNDLNHHVVPQHSHSRPTPDWKVVILQDLLSGYWENPPSGIIRVTFTPTSGTFLTGGNTERYTAEYEVNFPQPGVPWYPIPWPGPYKPKPKPKSTPTGDGEGQNEDSGTGTQN